MYKFIQFFYGEITVSRNILQFIGKCINFYLPILIQMIHFHNLNLFLFSSRNLRISSVKRILKNLSEHFYILKPSVNPSLDFRFFFIPYYQKIFTHITKPINNFRQSEHSVFKILLFFCRMNQSKLAIGDTLAHIVPLRGTRLFTCGRIFARIRENVPSYACIANPHLIKNKI